MKNILLSVGFMTVTLIACSQNKVINDANAVTRSAKNFHAVSAEDGIDLYISQGTEETVAVSASRPEYRDKITTVVENGVLRIYFAKSDWHFNWSSGKHLKAYVSFKSLDGLSGSGGSDIYVSGTIRVPKLKLTVSGGSDFEGAVDINDLNVDLSGGSDVKITGKSVNLKIDASGGGDFKGYELSSDMCYAEGSGGSDLQVRVNKELTVNTSGGSDVYYKGNGVIKEAKTSGGGSVSKRD
jgi:hypothetical protein